LTEAVTLVLTNVKNVMELSLTVPNVPMLTEDQLTSVHVPMDIMMMVLLPSVILVTESAEPVPTLTLVSHVPPTELKPQLLVLVKMVNTIAMMVIVAFVTPDVKLAENMTDIV
jgi:hypothetical protein